MLIRISCVQKKFFLKAQCCQMCSLEGLGIKFKHTKKTIIRIIQAIVDMLHSTRPSSASWASSFLVALFPWLLWLHRFLQGAFCHGNAFQSIVPLAGQVRGKMTFGQRSVFIYLFLWDERNEGHGGDDTLKKVFREQQKVGRGNKSWRQACGAPGGCKWRHSSSHVCAACPHLRQTHVVLIHRMRTDSFTLSPSLSLPRTLSCVSSSIPSTLPSLPFLLLWQQSSFLSRYIFPFHISHIPCQHLFYTVSPSWWCPSSFISPLSLLNTSAFVVLVIHSNLRSLKYFPTGAL